jgi:alpha-ketoglutarate-dependent taurine dioxygenase
LNLAAWLDHNRELVSNRLRQHGGILFRGFTVSGPPEFEACVKAVSGELLEYLYRSTPRTRVAGKIYTSTTYPHDRSIPLHNEMSYSQSWPLKIWFLSVVPAQHGGRTPIADSRKVFNRISPVVREQFERRQVMYVRNYGLGLDLPWQDVFQTGEKAEVERLCRSVGIEFTWKAHDGLTTRQICQATAVHPQTGEQVWFNQAHLFHVSSLDTTARELLLQTFAEDELPRNAFYGDGGAIEASALDEIRDALNAEAVLFSWEKGDVLLLDNMLTAHGREPFEGPRQVLTGMAERYGTGAVCVEI